MAKARRVLVIGDGDVTGLLACAAVGGEPGQHLVWTPRMSGVDVGGGRAAASARQAELFGLGVVEEAPAVASGADGTVANRVLVEAIALAASKGVDEIVWPIGAGAADDAGMALERIARNADRAVLASRLAGLDGRGLSVLTPYVDFTDRHLADLVVDMDLPVWTCWWWEGDAVERGRWLKVLGEAGWEAEIQINKSVRQQSSK